jgi:small subunit ribosomal protein S18
LFSFLVEVSHDEQKQIVTVEGKYVQSKREPLLVKEYVECQKDGKKFCPECTLNLDIKHTDVLILSQYVRPDGCMLPRRVTGLCRRQQKRIGSMVTMAQKAGLMINLTPAHCNKDPTKRRKYKAFNTYFDESTIKLDRNC